MFDVLWFILYVCAVFTVIIASAIGMVCVMHVIFSRWCSEPIIENRHVRVLMEHQRKN